MKVCTQEIMKAMVVIFNSFVEAIIHSIFEKYLSGCWVKSHCSMDYASKWNPSRKVQEQMLVEWIQVAGPKHTEQEAMVIEVPCKVTGTLGVSHEVQKEW